MLERRNENQLISMMYFVKSMQIEKVSPLFSSHPPRRITLPDGFLLCMDNARPCLTLISNFPVAVTSGIYALTPG